MRKTFLSVAGASLIAGLTLTPTIASADYRYHRDYDRGRTSASISVRDIGIIGMTGMPMTMVGIIATTMTTIGTETKNGNGP
jgi:hypothetical protein